MGAQTSIEWAANADGTPGATWNPIRASYSFPAEVEDPQARPGEVITRVGTHCVHASEGCRNCYAETLNKRKLPGNGTGLPYTKQAESLVRIFLEERMLAAPLRRRKPTTWFLSSMTDVFADFVSDDMLDKLFAVMALSPHHTFIVLTKRAERMRAYVSGTHEILGRQTDLREAIRSLTPFPPDKFGDALETTRAHLLVSGTLAQRGPLPNVCLGVSVENQPTADERIPHLLATPARWRALSAEPLLEAIESFRYIELHRRIAGDFNHVFGTDTHAKPGTQRAYYNPYGARSVKASDGKLLGIKPDECIDLPTLDWVICGGESGPGARPMHPDWARSLRDQCAAANVPFFFKQWGEHRYVEIGPHEPPSPHLSCIDRDGKDCALSYADGQWWYLAPTAAGWSRCSAIPPSLARATVRGKATTGRLLDGVEHNARPALHEVDGRKGEALATRVASPGRPA